MNRSTVVLLGLATFALVILSFLVLGIGRLFVGPDTATLLAAPTTIVAALLAVFLFVRLSLCALGIRPLDIPE